MKPKLPNRAVKDLNLIRRNSWNGLLECVAYAMEHPRGDGRTILNLGDGNMTARPGRGGGDVVAGDNTGMFTILERDGEILVLDTGMPDNTTSAGIAHVNNAPFKVPAVRYPLPEDGMLYVYLHYDASAVLAKALELSGITYDGKTPDGPKATIETSEEPMKSTFQHTYYLIGRISVLEKSVTIMQDHRPGNLYMEWYGYAVGIAEEVRDA